MEIKIKMSLEDVQSAVEEYLAKRGFKYLGHETSSDGSLMVDAEPAPVPEKKPVTRDGVSPKQRNPREAAVEEQSPALSFSELMAPPEDSLEVDDAIPREEVSRQPPKDEAVVHNELEAVLREHEALRARGPRRN